MCVTVEVLPQLRILGCVRLQTRACYRNYGWPGVHDSRRVFNVVTGAQTRAYDSRRVRAAATTAGQVYTGMITDACVQS